MEDKEFRSMLITLLELDSDDERPTEELMILANQMERASVDKPYIYNHPLMFANMPYIAAVQEVLNTERIDFLHSSFLRFDPDRINTLDEMVDTKEEHRDMLFQFAREKILNWKSNGYCGLDKLIKCVKNIEDYVGFLDVFEKIIETEEEDEVKKFLTCANKASKILEHTDDPEDGIANLGSAMVEVGAYLRSHNISREDFFVDMINNHFHVFKDVDDFRQNAYRIAEAMDRLDYKPWGKKIKRESRFNINFYTIWHQMEHLTGLTNDVDGIVKTLEHLVPLAVRVDASMFERRDALDYYHGSSRLNEYYRVIGGLCKKFTKHDDLGTFIDTLLQLEGARADLSYLSHSFDTVNKDKKRVHELLQTPTMIIAYTNLIVKRIIKNSEKKIGYKKLMVEYLDQVKSKTGLQRLDRALRRMSHPNTAGIEREYDLEKFCSQTFSIIKHYLPTLRELDDRGVEVVGKLADLKEHFNDWSGSRDNMSKKMSILMKVSSTFDELYANANRYWRHIQHTSNTCRSGVFMGDVARYFPEPESYDDIRRNISMVQKYLRKWDTQNLQTQVLVADGLKAISHLLEEDMTLHEALEGLDAIVSSYEDPDLISEAIDKARDIGQYHSPLKHHVSSLEEYATLVSHLTRMITGLDKHGLGIRDFNINESGTGSNYGLKAGDFFEHIEECEEICSQGFIPSSIILKLYLPMTESGKEHFLTDVKERMDKIKEEEKFDPRNMMDQYAIYHVALHKKSEIRGYRINLQGFDSFHEDCQNYVAGKHVSQKHETALDMLQNYSIVEPGSK